MLVMPSFKILREQKISPGSVWKESPLLTQVTGALQMCITGLL